MKGNIDLRTFEIVNPKIPESDNALALASVKTLRNQWDALEPAFKKSNGNVFPITNQIVTASSHDQSSVLQNAFDNTLTTERVTETPQMRSWIKIELPTAKQIWTVSLH